MTPYPHIDSVYKRDGKGKFIIGEFSTPEFKYLRDLPWIWTEKIDGTNIRIMWDGKDVRYGGKTDNAQMPTKLVNWLNEHLCDNGGETDIGLSLAFNSSTFSRLFGDEVNVCLYGEGYGAGIQSGGLYSPEQKFILFDVRIGHTWLTRDSVEDIAAKLGIDVVPLLVERSLMSQVDLIRDIANSGGLISSIGTARMEGAVGTPAVPLFNRRYGRVIVKVKVKDFI